MSLTVRHKLTLVQDDWTLLLKWMRAVPRLIQIDDHPFLHLADETDNDPAVAQDLDSIAAVTTPSPCEPVAIQFT